MRNKRLIVLNGLSRGGTNVVWNILQSHPDVCGTFLETGEIFYKRAFRWAPLSSRRLLTDPDKIDSLWASLLMRRADRVIHKHKMRTPAHPELGCKYEGTPYMQEEVRRAAVCLKSNDEDIYLVPTFRKFYPDACFLGLIRNGYAWCNGWMRRGHTAAESGRVYLRLVQQLINYSEQMDRFILLRWENVLADPFGEAHRMFEFCGLEPLEIPQIRLKLKRVLSPDRQHQPRIGEENQHQWFGREDIAQALDRHIDQTQAGLLADSDREDFEREAKPVLDYFGYTPPAPSSSSEGGV